MTWEAETAELSKPLDSAHVKPGKSFGPKGDYIEAWHAQAEANRIFGFGGWVQEIVKTECVMQAEREIGKDKAQGWGVTYTACVRIHALGVVREDFGAGHGYDRDLGLAHESAIKEAVSDAMKRAMKSFGNPFGLALYDKTKANVQDTSRIERDAARDKAIIDTNCHLESCTSLDDLASTFMTAKEVWRRRWNDPLPQEIIDTKDAMKARLKEEKAA